MVGQGPDIAFRLPVKGARGDGLIGTIPQVIAGIVDSEVSLNIEIAVLRPGPELSVPGD